MRSVEVLVLSCHMSARRVKLKFYESSCLLDKWITYFVAAADNEVNSV